MISYSPSPQVNTNFVQSAKLGFGANITLDAYNPGGQPAGSGGTFSGFYCNNKTDGDCIITLGRTGTAQSNLIIPAASSIYIPCASSMIKFAVAGTTGSCYCSCFQNLNAAN